MKNHFTFLSSDEETQIHCIEWIPEGTVKAVLQICHGMVEFIDRYDRYGTYMAEQGFYVIGHDHLGHGESVKDENGHGHFHENGNECLIKDIHHVRKMTMEKYPDVPYFILGHSMGSFLVRQYIEMHGEGLNGAIVMGTGNQPAPVIKFAKSECKRIARFRGWKFRSKRMNNLAIGGYNKAFEPARTTADWLTRDEKIVDAYVAHPWCNFVFTVNAYYYMFAGIEYMQNPKHIANIPKKLPIFLVSGARDPVGNFGKSVRKVHDIYKAAGIKDVKLKLYPEDRHEILNELDRDQVYEDLREWMEERM